MVSLGHWRHGCGAARYERSVAIWGAYDGAMARITFIGAGSTVFARNLMGDILSFPELASSTIVLHDINEERLRTSEIVGHKIVETLGVSARIEATTDRRAALAGADYVITMFQVGGYKPSTVIDFEIPKKYGLEQTIADTLGIGGIMRGLRTIPVMLEQHLADMEEEDHMLLVNIPSWQILHIHFMLVVVAPAALQEILVLYQQVDIMAEVMVLPELLVLVD